MTKFFTKISLILLGLIPFLQANDSLLSIKCDNDSIGSKVYVNNEYKGDCSSSLSPINLFLNAGEIKVRVIKMMGKNMERVFERDLFLVAGQPVRVHIELSKSQLTQEAQQAKKEAKLQKEKQEAQEDLKLAKSGNVEAMRRLSKRYTSGIGVIKSSSKAAHWNGEFVLHSEIKKAHTGNIMAINNVIKLYKNVKGLDKDKIQQNYWVSKLEIAKKNKQKQIKAKNKKYAQQKLDNTSYFKNIKDTVRDSEEAFGGQPNGFTEAMSIALSTSPVILLTNALADVSSSPSRFMEKMELEKKIETHASTWGDSSSMIARAALKKSKKQDL